MTERDAAVRVKGVSHQFGEAGETQYVRALSDTSLDIARGELLCLIGPSGCGKSTLLNIMGGLMEPAAGTVDVGVVLGDGAVDGRVVRLHRLRRKQPVHHRSQAYSGESYDCDWRNAAVQADRDVSRRPDLERNERLDVSIGQSGGGDR